MDAHYKLEAAIVMRYCIIHIQSKYTLRPRENDRHFADSIFKCIFLNEK